MPGIEEMKAEQIIEDMPSALLLWYSFEKPGHILYLTNGVFRHDKDCLVRELQAQGRDVICAAVSEVMRGDFQQKHEGEFSYIISIEDLEQTSIPMELLAIWKGLLKADGTLLLGMNNRLGLRYFCGEKDLYTQRCFDSIEKYRKIRREDIGSIPGQMYARAEIEQLLDRTGFQNRKFYSVLPNLDAPQMIFAEDYLPREELGMRLFPMYRNPDTVYLEEEYLYTSLAENGIFHQLVNAYLVECPLGGSFNKAEQVTTSIDRGKKNALATIVCKDGVVIKRALYQEGCARISSFQEYAEDLENHGIAMVPARLVNGNYEMPFVESVTGSAYLRKLFFEDKEEFIAKMDAFRELILHSSELEEREVHISELYGNKKKELSDNGTDVDNIGIQKCLRHGYIDLVPLNSFYTDKGFIFYDQEFCEDYLPANVIVTRLVDLVYQGDNKMEEILPREFFFERYGLSEHLDVWRNKSDTFIYKLRNGKSLRSFLERHRRNDGITNSNRQRMNFSATGYQKIFVDIFSGLENKKLFLFGSGNFAKQFIAYYKTDYAIAGILDNNEGKWGSELEGIPICSPAVLKELAPQEYKVIICIKNYIGVLNQLKNAGVQNYAIYDIDVDYPRKSWQAAVMPAGKETAGKKYHIGYIAGVFDLYHIGHLNMFRRAKEQCDYLIVGVVTDEGVFRNKKTRPFVPFEERIEMVRACQYVDEAVEIPLDYNTTRDAYRRYHFDVQFSGSDYADNPDWLADKQYLESRGSTMVFFPYTQSTSSSQLKELISQRLV